ncbi:MAG: transporter substrate-binding domain-containing protein [Bacillota bacterium]|uniref:Polar amino acid transport system substrate-binding protein n=1 Tax=[Clostridium] aminophilum TaxID=1526 RepID=A0A1I6JPY2_9FIRM|nr:transporter substrate-binding domain-containing protein [[Clostridium] aminophilum]MDT3844135.1 transporter substrate-binding domain-containing protein [Bacillota bacterium]SFR80580.1 polar amino acid transport system substrate-binding protein [[Clostridium] aminophilum]
MRKNMKRETKRNMKGNMKKIIAFGAAAVMAAAFTACAPGSAATQTAKAEETTKAAETAKAEETAKAAETTKAADAGSAAAEEFKYAEIPAVSEEWKAKYDAISGGRLDEIRKKGVIQIASEPYFAPYEFIDSSKQGDEQYCGADVQFAKFIADRMGVKMEYVPLEFSAVLTSVVEGKTDLAISGLAYTPERAEACNMSDGYYTDPKEAGHGLLIREENKDKIKGLDDLADKTIVFQAGSLQEALVDAAGVKVGNIKKVSSSNDAYMAVQEGKADAAAVYKASAKLYAEANPGLTLVEGFKFDVPKEMQGNHVGIMKDEEALTEFVNTCIAELDENGLMGKWVETASAQASSLGVD